jgi:hypothetical protein
MQVQTPCFLMMGVEGWWESYHQCVLIKGE